MMKRFLLFAKGACMGVADIIPGVSGGTLALILGIYAELVNTIKGLHLRWVPPLIRWGLKRSPEARQDFWREFETLNATFLVILGAGIATAIVAGSMVIPGLMERFPEAMRALFFGLIIASVVVPFKMIDFKETKQRVLVGAMVAVGAVAGFMLTDPGRVFEASVQWVEVVSEEETLKDLTRRQPSAWPTEQVFWAPQNEPLREALLVSRPELAEHFGTAPTERIYDKDEIKSRSERFDILEVPAGVPVQIPQPAIWFVFIAGLIGICAMILPGISGSYILLILGVYFFVLNSLKGTITTLASGGLPWSSGVFVAVFMAGAAIGILSFARLLSYLLRRFPAITLGVLVGLMIGCLRGIWPFRTSVDGMIVNAWPATVDGAVISAVMTFAVGVALVTLLTRAGRKKTEGRVAHR